MTKKASLIPVLLIAAGSVLLIAAIGWLIWNNAAGTQHRNGERIGLEEAKRMVDGRKAHFLDVRAKSDFDAAHIPGAINLPEGELAGRLHELDKAVWYIVYCT